MTQTNPAKAAGLLVAGPVYFIGSCMFAIGVGLGSAGLIPPAFSLFMGKTDSIGWYFQKTAKIGLSLWAMGAVGAVIAGAGAAGANAAIKKDEA